MWLVLIGQAHLEIWKMEDVIWWVWRVWFVVAKFLLIFINPAYRAGHTVVRVLIYYGFPMLNPRRVFESILGICTRQAVNLRDQAIVNQYSDNCMTCPACRIDEINKNTRTTNQTRHTHHMTSSIFNISTCAWPIKTSHISNWSYIISRTCWCQFCKAGSFV